MCFQRLVGNVLQTDLLFCFSFCCVNCDCVSGKQNRQNVVYFLLKKTLLRMKKNNNEGKKGNL